MAAAKGNQYAAKERVWAKAIDNALEARGKALGRMGALVELAECLIVKCSEGDMTALKELGDRLDGKSTQTIAGDPDAPLIPDSITINIRRPE